LGVASTVDEILASIDAFGPVYRVKKNRLVLTEKGLEILNPILLALLELRDNWQKARST
jgi:Mn-dependent DtxR family transcriptional regulator